MSTREYELLFTLFDKQSKVHQYELNFEQEVFLEWFPLVLEHVFDYSDKVRIVFAAILVRDEAIKSELSNKVDEIIKSELEKSDSFVEMGYEIIVPLTYGIKKGIITIKILLCERG